MISEENLENGGFFKCNKDMPFVLKGDICYICKNKGESKNEYPYHLKIVDGKVIGDSFNLKWNNIFMKGLDKI